MNDLAPYEPERLSLCWRNTPLQPLHRFCQRRGLPPIWVKRDDLTHSVASGNKVRKLEYCLAEAQASGADVVLTFGGVQSNHCRSTALLCAQLGLACHLVLRSNDALSQADGNLLLDWLAGAEVDYVPARKLALEQADIEADLIERYAQRGLKVHVIPIGASDATGVWGYIDASRELARDCKEHGLESPAIVHATGSGGTQAGLIAGCSAYFDAADVFGINVCDDSAWFQNKIGEDLRRWEDKFKVLGFAPGPINILDGHVGEGYAKASDEVLVTIAELAREEGLILDPVYAGKAFHGLLEEIRVQRLEAHKSLVFVHTGGVFGLFPFRDRLSDLLRDTQR